jgi:hypothetical protein
MRTMIEQQNQHARTEKWGKTFLYITSCHEWHRVLFNVGKYEDHANVSQIPKWNLLYYIIFISELCLLHVFRIFLYW